MSASAITELENWLKLMHHDPTDSTPIEDAVVEAIEALKACDRAKHYNQPVAADTWDQRMERLACFGAVTVEQGEMRECLHCLHRVAWDLVNHPFFGFKSSCPMKGAGAK